MLLDRRQYAVLRPGGGAVRRKLDAKDRSLRTGVGQGKVATMGFDYVARDDQAEPSAPLARRSGEWLEQTLLRPRGQSRPVVGDFQSDGSTVVRRTDPYLAGTGLAGIAQQIADRPE